MARVVTRSCPHCGSVYQVSGSSYTTRYGTPFRNCRKCGQGFVDKDYMEVGLSPAKQTRPWVLKGKTVFLLCVAVITIPLTLVWSEAIIFSVISGVLGGLFLILNPITYKKRVAEWEVEYNESCSRLRNPEYRNALISIGVVIPESQDWDK